MFCSACGTELPDNAQFCTDCGNRIGDQAAEQPQTPPQHEQSMTNGHLSIGTGTATPAPTSAEKPTWKKAVTWAFLFIVGVIALATITTSGLMDPVEAHLDALRGGDVESAYLQTSKDFRENTPLPAFKKFVAAYPILNKNSAFSMEQRGFEGSEGKVTGHLLIDGERFSRIEFLMTKGDDDWKIHGIKITSVLVAPVSEHLAALRNKEIESAYRSTSEEFRANTSLPAFQKFVANYPILTQHTSFSSDQFVQKESEGGITGYLLFNNQKAAWIEFILAKESGDWKIYRMQLKKP